MPSPIFPLRLNVILWIKVGNLPQPMENFYQFDAQDCYQAHNDNEKKRRIEKEIK